MSKKLYEIVNEAQIIEQQIIESGGELSPELEKRLNEIDITLTEKVEGYAQVMDRLDSNAEYWKLKAKEYSALAKGLDNVTARIKERLKKAMIDLRKEEVFGESIRFKLSTTKGSLVIEDQNKIPMNLMMEVTTIVPDKDRIRTALESCELVPGAKLEGGYSLRKYAHRKA